MVEKNTLVHIRGGGAGVSGELDLIHNFFYLPNVM